MAVKIREVGYYHVKVVVKDTDYYEWHIYLWQQEKWDNIQDPWIVVFINENRILSPDEVKLNELKAKSLGITEDGLYLVNKGINPTLIRNCNVFIPVNKSPIGIEKLHGLADKEIIYDIEKNIIYCHTNNKDFKFKDEI